MNFNLNQALFLRPINQGFFDERVKKTGKNSNDVEFEHGQKENSASFKVALFSLFVSLF
jgi:hypothetical protein